MTVRFVAHRAGNSVDALRQAEHIVETVEVDVHGAGVDSPEVRHAKRVWFTDRLWDRWFLLPRGSAGVRFGTIVDAAAPKTVLWVDLKGVDPRLPSKVLQALGEREFVASSKSWWMLRHFTSVSTAQTFRSAGNRFELALLLLRQLGPNRVSGSVVHARLLSPRVLRRLLLSGDVYTWAANDAELIARLAGLGVAGFIVDDLDVVAEGAKAIGAQC